ncbi:tripartite tricarboxylate transporter TctB family protein [Pikeienuella piscinae]|uniref:Tripartite tricarboxylate transporter TctB family protein n=1 Tax=Pikeienuella piscinae TaxID=2748098 RepID=A0A7L5C1G9_9RHOB|nr:tripartite tricarboxylate transporter TctB family protein [Pikeienuella piscinae]QIE55699.1 tripartite tricarboxylate transporter TctB family protein [Pikeienuella piscinae]
MRLNDAVIGAFLIVFAIAEIAYTTTFPSLHGQDFGPDLFPILIGIGLIICGVALIFRGQAARREAGAGALIALGPWAKDRRMALNLGLLILGVILYILLADPVGFIPVSTALLTVLMLRLRVSALTSVIVAVVTTLVIHSLFAKLLLVPLPWGVLLPVAW